MGSKQVDLRNVSSVTLSLTVADAAVSVWLKLRMPGGREPSRTATEPQSHRESHTDISERHKHTSAQA